MKLILAGSLFKTEIGRKEQTNDPVSIIVSQLQLPRDQFPIFHDCARHRDKATSEEFSTEYHSMEGRMMRGDRAGQANDGKSSSLDCNLKTENGPSSLTGKIRYCPAHFTPSFGHYYLVQKSFLATFRNVRKILWGVTPSASLIGPSKSTPSFVIESKYAMPSLERFNNLTSPIDRFNIFR